MERLLFDGKSEFKKGPNYTVRLGEKWKNKINILDIVRLQAFPYDHLGEVQEIICCRLACIPERVFKNEHAESCRTGDGLIKKLQEVYEELEKLDMESIENVVVTCIGFNVYRCEV